MAHNVVVTAFFPDKVAAEAAYMTLPDFGIDTEDVNLIGRHGEMHLEPLDDTGRIGSWGGAHLVVHDHKIVVQDSRILDGALTGAGAGTVLGAVAGMALGSAFVVLPALGLFLAGPLVGALVGASLAAGETITHALKHVGMTDAEAREMASALQDRLKKGGMALVVTTEPDRALEVQRALEKLGGKLVAGRTPVVSAAT